MASPQHPNTTLTCLENSYAFCSRRERVPICSPGRNTFCVYSCRYREEKFFSIKRSCCVTIRVSVTANKLSIEAQKPPQKICKGMCTETLWAPETEFPTIFISHRYHPRFDFSPYCPQLASGTRSGVRLSLSLRPQPALPVHTRLRPAAGWGEGWGVWVGQQPEHALRVAPNTCAWPTPEGCRCAQPRRPWSYQNPGFTLL